MEYFQFRRGLVNYIYMSGILGWLRNAFIGMKVCPEIPSLLLYKDYEFQSSWCHIATEFEIASDMVKP